MSRLPQKSDGSKGKLGMNRTSGTGSGTSTSGVTRTSKGSADSKSAAKKSSETTVDSGSAAPVAGSGGTEPAKPLTLDATFKAYGIPIPAFLSATGTAAATAAGTTAIADPGMTAQTQSSPVTVATATTASNQNANANVRLFTLPEEVLSLVYEHLSSIELIRLAVQRVCKAFGHSVFRSSQINLDLDSVRPNTSSDSLFLNDNCKRTGNSESNGTPYKTSCRRRIETTFGFSVCTRTRTRIGCTDFTHIRCITDG
jgi:hypothetical protein